MSSFTQFTAGVEASTRRALLELKRLISASQAEIAINTHSGDIKATVIAAAPTGWLMLDGSTIVGGQTLHPDLWAVIPAGWKSGANIVLPDARGRALIGAGTGSGLTARALGTVIAGEESHLLTAAESGLVGHNHAQDAHSHIFAAGWGAGAIGTVKWDGTFNNLGYGLADPIQYTTATNIAAAAANAAAAHNNMQPSIAFNLMVKT